MTKLQDIAKQLRHVIHGKQQVVDYLLTALCSNGHVLVEDVPGVGKTTLAKALAQTIHGDFHRIQFTPDLLPTDIVGGQIYSPGSGHFTFRPGPIFCNILLGDEINRASPRTQSALLEAMNERQVTTEGHTHQLDQPFMVIATQNPIEYHGTYPLPEAQLDRFAMQLEMGYPNEQQEIDIIQQQRQYHPLADVKPVASLEDIIEFQTQVRNIDVEQSIVSYMTSLVRSTRTDARLQLGASPRASLILYRNSQALALLRGRDYVIPDDVKELAIATLAHRLVLQNKAVYAGTSKEDIVADIVNNTDVPI